MFGKTTVVTAAMGTLCWMAKEASEGEGDCIRYKKSSDIQVLYKCIDLQYIICLGIWDGMANCLCYHFAQDQAFPPNFPFCFNVYSMRISQKQIAYIFVNHF